MDRDILADRLDLEDKLGRGCLKISIYVAMFILIITCLSLGIPSSEKLATKHLLEKALDLDTFLEIRTIDGLRDFLPELSKNIKVFSASSVTVAGTEILSQRLEFTDPVTINEFAPVMSQPSWTLSAWIERFAGGCVHPRPPHLPFPQTSPVSLLPLRPPSSLLRSPSPT